MGFGNIFHYDIACRLLYPYDSSPSVQELAWLVSEHGNRGRLVQETCSHTQLLYIIRSEVRPGKARTCQYMHFFSKSKLKLSGKDRIHFGGLSTDDSMGPIQLPSFESPEVFKAKYKEKAALYGEARVRSGGRADQDSSDSDEATHKPPAPNDLVPMTYAGMSWKVFDELVHDCSIVAWIETTMADTTLAEVCCHRKIPFTGVVPTQLLKDKLMMRLVERLWESFVDESHRDHKFSLVKFLRELRAKPATKQQVIECDPKKKDEKSKAEADSDSKGAKRTSEDPPEPKSAKKSKPEAKAAPATSDLLAKLKAFESDD